jgi:hypothetical protein
VADVQQVEHAVAMNHFPPLAAKAGQDGGEFGQGLDLVAGRHAIPKTGHATTGCRR